MTRRKRSGVWRMARLSRLKFDAGVIGRRFKRLAKDMVKELNLELTVLDQLEQDVYAALQSAGVPPDLWEPYMSFAKRIWEARVSFTGATYIGEATSLVNEFTLRGLNVGILAQLQPLAEARALQKRM